MIRSSVTISLVNEARGGPFVYWDDFEASCQKAKALGFDAVELFAPKPNAVPAEQLRRVLETHDLKLAAVGTGAGWVIQRLQLCDPDKATRAKAIDFIRSMIDYGGPFGAPAIIGSMQGRAAGAVDRDAALGMLGEALDELGNHARQYETPLIYEPLNRYETNLITTVADGVTLLESISTDNVRLLTDLFHMNIEEADIAAALKTGGKHVGHLHFVDSNRQAAGRGHMDYAPIAAALKEIGYDGYASAEAFAIPSSDEAAQQTINAFRQWFGA
ncbi:D-tagatose 3-epimerase [Planctomycetes bacterium Pan216]|uniref:D-tagatose 3-epimerase n=1 Tax=Kolteria novifilia TaxID=2527975 RepID=A0A518B939_9BACT|nr:D-tagatose 3-epimerase [Planctomycetes bacterium Pan216]